MSRPRSLYSNLDLVAQPPVSHKSDEESSSYSDGDYSDFPPPRVRASTPDQLSPPPPTQRRRPSSSPDPQPSQLRSPSQRPRRGLGSKNSLNTTKVPKSSSSSKRSSETLDVSEGRPSKRKRIISTNHDDTRWLRSEINGIRGSIRKFEARFRDMDKKLGEILSAIE
ncbi:hypothetical protein HYPSUDRAFT_210132 [Hypholoma sublateritium FD-334 SS-4]|uniref:Uncharacterized protein n=2 Tax=Hypholoma sublateritium (strain FD-334 SS-4) TaxID=945553 RepID=A0A0D2N7N3_HYPSF|nr:hypothetical protein HYPSUDRAFT_210132 [Hypholoma sublateritium FD-334 SS-4]